jgi:uncharacterized phage-associated protein
MKEIIECAYCDGNAHLHRTGKELNYRKEVFKVIEHFYKCKECKEEFTTTETDTVTLLQAHNQYRERHNIPFPEEILAIREKYEISATKMSEVLGLGVNGYGNYEKGEIPTPAIGNLISTSGKPEVFKSMLEKAKLIFSNGSYANAIEKVNFLIDKERVSQPFYVKLNQHTEANSLTGFKKPNKDKIAGVLISYINKCNQEFNDRLKLNKLLFYSDFVSYKLFGTSITGLSYRAIDYGPVPTFYDNIYTYFENENIIASKWIKDSNGSAKETFTTEAGVDSKLFNDEERLVLEIIAEAFKNISSWDLVELSHKEQGWIDLHPGREIINYQQYAFNLVGA